MSEKQPFETEPTTRHSNSFRENWPWVFCNIVLISGMVWIGYVAFDTQNKVHSVTTRLASCGCKSPSFSISEYPYQQGYLVEYRQKRNVLSDLLLPDKLDELTSKLQQLEKEGVISPAGPPGPQGLQGIQGPPGKDGEDGRNGTDGLPGKDGIPGRDGREGEPGRNGTDGLSGEDGMPGLDGISGRDGKEGEPGRNGTDGIPGKDGMPGKNGIPGEDGRPGINGTDGKDCINDGPSRVGVDLDDLTKLIDSQISQTIQKGAEQDDINSTITNPQTSGAVYTRWGRTTCPTSSSMIMNGRMGGQYYKHRGGSSNYICMPQDPEYGIKEVHTNWTNYIYATEYETPGQNFFEHTAPCSLCLTQGRTTQLMLPAKMSCPDNSWTLEYIGFLMSQHFSYVSSEYVCVDQQAEKKIGTQTDNEGALLYYVRITCQGNGAFGDCPPYVPTKPITCVVCSK